MPRVEFVIWLDETGAVGTECAQMNNRVMCYGMLRVASEQLQKHYDKLDEEAGGIQERTLPPKSPLVMVPPGMKVPHANRQ